MTPRMAVYGRLGKDARTVPAKTTISIAVGVSTNEVEKTLWLEVLTFSSMTDTILKYGKGGMVSVSGYVQMNGWMVPDGAEKVRFDVH